MRVAVFAFSVLFLCLLWVVRPSLGSKFLFGRCAVQRPKKPSTLAIFSLLLFSVLSVVFMRAFLCGLFWMLRIFFGLFFAHVVGAAPWNMHVFAGGSLTGRHMTMLEVAHMFEVPRGI